MNIREEREDEAPDHRAASRKAGSAPQTRCTPPSAGIHSLVRPTGQVCGPTVDFGAIKAGRRVWGGSVDAGGDQEAELVGKGRESVW